MHVTENRDSHVHNSQWPAPGHEHWGAFLSSKGKNMAQALKPWQLRSTSSLPPGLIGTSMAHFPGGPLAYFAL